MVRLPLTFTNGRRIHYRDDRVRPLKNELEEFLSHQSHLNTKAFAKDVMFSHELKANNQIEGYLDDVRLVEAIIARNFKNPNSELVRRILNLYHGYNYILKGNDINKENLKKLYSILSKNLLCTYDREHMGEYYRNARVFIYFNGIVSRIPDEGIECQKIDEFMDKYFDFLHNYSLGTSITDEYIKSQILHFYFVYIHPYFDVNGRTSRTLAMWYLLNKKAYSYIIFNRGIAFKGSKYDRSIIDVKKSCDITYFIEFMLKTVSEELEKEYIMESIAGNIDQKLSSLDYQTLLYLLSMNSLLTVKDFAITYNRFNDCKKVQEIYETMIDPLINKGVLNVTGHTSKNMFKDYKNEILEFNPDVMDYDHSEIRRLTKYK